MLLELKQEWQSNQRLRVMLYMIAFTLMFYLLLLLSDFSDEKLQQLSRNQELLHKISLIQNEPVWYEREKEAASHRVSFQNQLWQASSQGLAQAKVQAFLRSTIDSYKLSNSRIVLESVKQIDPNGDSLPLWRISAQVRASFKSNQLQQLLWSITTHPQLIKVRSLNFNLNTNKNSFSSFTLYVDAWFANPIQGQNNE